MCSPVNVALGKPTLTSSRPELSDRAVDGNRNAHYFAGSCTHTDSEMNAWWSVDLQHTYQVVRVDLTNRADCCGISSLMSFSILVKRLIMRWTRDQGAWGSIPTAFVMCKSLWQALNPHRRCPPSSNGYQVEQILALREWLQLQIITLHFPLEYETVNE